MEATIKEGNIESKNTCTQVCFLIIIFLNNKNFMPLFENSCKVFGFNYKICTHALWSTNILKLIRYLFKLFFALFLSKKKKNQPLFKCFKAEKLDNNQTIHKQQRLC